MATASLDEGERRELHVLQVCLGEVRRCRPFLIVLLGDRYGWVPPPERIAQAASEEGWAGEIAGRRVTDLEITFGVLGDPELSPRSFFYFSELLPYAQMQSDVAALYSDVHSCDSNVADRSRRLVALKREIMRRFPDRERHYSVGWDSKQDSVTGLDDWDKPSSKIFCRNSMRKTARSEAEQESSWQQIERNALDDYVEDRCWSRSSGRR